MSLPNLENNPAIFCKILLFLLTLIIFVIGVTRFFCIEACLGFDGGIVSLLISGNTTGGIIGLLIGDLPLLPDVRIGLLLD